MTTPDRRRSARLLSGAHLGQAAILLTQPTAVVRTITGLQGVPPAWILRVLGARLLVQAAPEAIRPTAAVLRLGVLVDLAHAASMLGAARIWPRYRRAALASSGSACASAIAGALLARARR